MPVLGLVACALIAGASPAWAGDDLDQFTVNSNLDTDDGMCVHPIVVPGDDCTLREAMLLANDNDSATQDQITISLGILNTLIELGSPLPGIDDALAISKSGVNFATVSGKDTHRVFLINPDAGENVSISGITITDGLGAGTFTSGGAIYSQDANLALTNVAITGSSAASFGGGLAVPTGSLTIQTSTVSGNTSVAGGGGIYSASPTTIRQSTIWGNNTTGNTSQSTGGGLNLGGTVGTDLIENTTISGNHTTGTDADGGGLVASARPLTITDSTISGNYTQGTSTRGGGMAVNNNATLSNSIVANNYHVDAGSVAPDMGAYGANTYNTSYSLIENIADAPITHTVADSNLTGQDPALGGLHLNGGTTLSHRPLPASPVLDKGNSAVSTDQRGFVRPVDFIDKSQGPAGDASDMGAVEIQNAARFASIDPAASSTDDTPTVFGVLSPPPLELFDPSVVSVSIFTDAVCADQTGPTASYVDFSTTGIEVDPVPHNFVSTFHSQTTGPYGTSACSSGAFPNTIRFTHGTPPVPAGPPPAATGPTGLRAAALKKCAKIKNKKKKKKCKKRARRLPV